MFCQNCGAKLEDDACFCTMCGSKITAVNEEVVQSVQTPPTAGQIQQQMPYVWTEQAVQQPKKKKRVMPFLIGGTAIFLVVVFLCIITGNNEIDYIRTVQEYTPFADSQGLPYTLQEVLDAYFEDLVWKETTGYDDKHCVDIQGRMKTTGENLRLSVDVVDNPVDPELCHFSFRLIELGEEHISDENEIVNILAGLYYYYDEGYDIEGLLDKMNSPVAETDMQNDSLTRAYSESYADMVPIMQTKSFYYEGFGNLEVTLNEAGFVDSYLNDWGIQNYPDDGNVFLWISFTANNIGTTNGMMPVGWNTLVYDGTYKYTDCVSVGNVTNIPPLSGPREGAFVFTLPISVMESDKSFVLNLNIWSEPVLSYTFNLSGESAGTSESETEYDTDPFFYTGKYVGYGGYEISFSSGTELDGDGVGHATIYYNGKLTAAQTVYACFDRGDWSDWDYDAFYVIHRGNYDEYLGFYEIDGKMRLDYNGVTKNIDTLEMTEYYTAP